MVRHPGSMEPGVADRRLATTAFPSPAACRLSTMWPVHRGSRLGLPRRGRTTDPIREAHEARNGGANLLTGTHGAPTGSSGRCGHEPASAGGIGKVPNIGLREASLSERVTQRLFSPESQGGRGVDAFTIDVENGRRIKGHGFAFNGGDVDPRFDEPRFRCVDQLPGQFLGPALPAAVSGAPGSKTRCPPGRRQSWIAFRVLARSHHHGRPGPRWPSSSRRRRRSDVRGLPPHRPWCRQPLQPVRPRAFVGRRLGKLPRGRQPGPGRRDGRGDTPAFPSRSRHPRSFWPRTRQRGPRRDPDRCDRGPRGRKRGRPVGGRRVDQARRKGYPAALRPHREVRETGGWGLGNTRWAQ